jgi:nicotinate-nucleotide adenylyltransferase
MMNQPGDAPRQIGIFGGTFDPPHLGHLAAAQEALELLQLQSVLFVPARRNPLKSDGPTTSAAHRWRMLEIAVGADDRFGVSRADLDRIGPSYTVDLIEHMREQIDDGTEIVFIMGTDSLADFDRWREPSRLLSMAQVVAVFRPGAAFPDLERLANAVPGFVERVALVQTPGVALSASDVRERIAVGRSVRYLVPENVRMYIERHGLYRSQEGNGSP